MTEPSHVATPDPSSVDVGGGCRACEWCEGVIPPRSRRDAKYCSTRCRQAAHRFKRIAVARRPTLEPMRFGYADPPYPGNANAYYGAHPDFGGEVDHQELVLELGTTYPDGWALSTSAEALPSVLASCPPGVRVAAWFRGERATKHYRPLSAWEPVVYFGGRARLTSPGSERRLDALIHRARPRLTDPRRVVGAKPATFCYWLFDLLGALPGDELVDLFPGSGGVARAWHYYGEASRLAAAEPDASGVTVATGDASSPIGPTVAEPYPCAGDRLRLGAGG